MNNQLKAIPALLAALACLASTGCRVDTHKENGNDNVKIATPFGGMSVKTNDNVVQGGVGLTVYPGATLLHKNEGSDPGAADVSMSFGSFHLGVKALSYTTPDDPGKVIAFYRKDMAKYGAVLLCQGDQPVGTPTHTQDGLSCSDDSNNNHVHTDHAGREGELKAGSKLHQHIVAIDHEGGATRIGLIALDLPGHLGLGDSDKD